jgi:uncharacterized protein YggE
MMAKQIVPFFAFCMLAVIFGVAEPARAGESRYIEVNGEGRVVLVPDLAEVIAGVTSRAPSAAEALGVNNALMEKILAALKNAGINDRDVSTSRFSVNPYFAPRNTNGPRKQEGYQVANQVKVRVRNLAGLGKLLDTIANSGANNVQGIRFSVDDPAASLDEARRRAVADAKRRAALLAEAAGTKLGAVIHIIERHAQAPRPRMMASAAISRSVPVAPGEQVVTAGVGIRFALE